MPVLRCDGLPVDITTGESLLEALLRAGVPLPHSCRAGACQSCLVKVTSGTPPPAGQVGLRPALSHQGFVLACLARPDSDLEISRDVLAAATVQATIASVTPLTANVVLVRLRLGDTLSYRPGQFFTVLRADGLARSYSVANLPDGETVEFHVRVLQGGRMSEWFASKPVGALVTLRGPNGECFYDPPTLDAPLLLAGTGTGLAPLWAIAQDALGRGHRGPIHLFHGARDTEGLYLVDTLEGVEAAHANVAYTRCLLDGDAGAASIGALDDVVFARYPSLVGYQVFLCGDPGLVQKMKRRAFLAGANLSDIHADAFVTAPVPAPGR